MTIKHKDNCASQSFIGGQGLEFSECDCGRKHPQEYELENKLAWVVEHNRTYYMGSSKNAAALAKAVLELRRRLIFASTLTNPTIDIDYDLLKVLWTNQ